MTQNERLSLPIWKKIILFVFSIIFFAIQVFITFIVLDISIEYTASPIKWIYFLTLGVGFCFVLYILHKPISVHYKLTWSILILTFPLPFIALYLFNTSSRRLSKRKQKKIANATKHIKINDALQKLKEEDTVGAGIAQVLKHSSPNPVWDNVKYTFFNDCMDKLNDAIIELEKAEKYIYIEYFVIAKGYLMDQLLPILEKKGNEGVEIKILYDDIGSKGVMSKKLLKRISAIPNCKINNYEPLGLNINFLVNNRDHRKIMVIDGRVAYCGGDNLADEYIHKKERFGYWRDNCGKYEGNIAVSFAALFAEMWYISTKEIIKLDIPLNEYDFDEPGYVMAFGDGPHNNANPAYDLFQSLISSANKCLYISTPYFVIDDQTISAIALKAKSGVDVRILMPKKPDKKSAFYMARANYREILKAGGKIYEYTPGFNHAKNIIVDNKYAYIGTVNMDYRSLFLHYECGALIMHKPQVNEMTEDFINALDESEEIDLLKWKKRPWYQKLIAFVFNIFAPLF